MGIIDGGILGGFRNKTGAVIGSFWRSLNTMRGLPRKSGKAATEAQLLQQRKFGLVTEVLSYVSPLIDVGYKAVSKVATPMNVAVREHLENAIMVAGGVVSFDYTKLTFSKGKLEPGYLMSVSSPAAAQMEFSWTHTAPNDKYVDASDKLSVLAYNKDKDRYVRMSGAAMRSAQEYTLILPADWSGDDIMCYYSFSSVKVRDLVSDSEYLGTIPMT